MIGDAMRALAGRTSARPRLGSTRRLRAAALVAGAACLILGVLLLVPPLPQPAAYHDFADARALLGVPNALNVLSNAGFVVAGVAGALVVRRRWSAITAPGERSAWLVVFLGTVATGLGSAWYHLAPSNDALFWDRLPMATSFMAVLSALLSERVDARAGARLLGPLCALGAASVVYWHVTELRGAGDLRPYVLVQAGSLAAIPVVLAWFPARAAGTADWLIALGLYAVAKALEVLDGAAFGAVGVSGHTLKHVVAAAAILWCGRMLWRRGA